MREKHVQGQILLHKQQLPFVPALDLRSPVSRQPVLHAVEPDHADTAPKPRPGKGDLRRGRHDGAVSGEMVALHPGVAFGKGTPGIPFDIAFSAGKVELLSVQADFSRHVVVHADDLMPALHGQKPKGPHDAPANRRKPAVTEPAREFQIPAGNGKADPVAGKPAVRQPEAFSPAVCRNRVPHATGALPGDGLEKGPVPGSPGNERQGFRPLLVLEIPAFKTVTQS